MLRFFLRELLLTTPRNQRVFFRKSFVVFCGLVFVSSGCMSFLQLSFHIPVKEYVSFPRVVPRVVPTLSIKLRVAPFAPLFKFVSVVVVLCKIYIFTV